MAVKQIDVCIIVSFNYLESVFGDHYVPANVKYEALLNMCYRFFCPNFL